jgi:hypothetical protein
MILWVEFNIIIHIAVHNRMHTLKIRMQMLCVWPKSPQIAAAGHQQIFKIFCFLCSRHKIANKSFGKCGNVQTLWNDSND